MLAGPDAIKSLKASVKNLQHELVELKGSKAGERFARLQADLKVHVQSQRFGSSQPAFDDHGGGVNWVSTSDGGLAHRQRSCS